MKASELNESAINYLINFVRGLRLPSNLGSGSSFPYWDELLNEIQRLNTPDKTNVLKTIKTSYTKMWVKVYLEEVRKVSNNISWDTVEKFKKEQLIVSFRKMMSLSILGNGQGLTVIRGITDNTNKANAQKLFAEIKQLGVQLSQINPTDINAISNNIASQVAHFISIFDLVKRG